MAHSARNLKCVRCSGAMEPGFLVDEGYGSRSVAKWVEGESHKSIWTGLKLRGREKRDTWT